MTPRSADSILSRPLAVADVAADGTTLRITASAEERDALARDLDVPAVARLEAEVVVRPWGKRGYRVTGRVTGALTQLCVVSLEPVETTVDEAIDIKLAPESDAARYAPARDAAGEIVVDPEAEDPPDFFAGATIDPGAIVEEHFVLGIDPYPRKPGIDFQPAALGVDEPPAPAPVSPFASLAKLKRD